MEASFIAGVNMSNRSIAAAVVVSVLLTAACAHSAASGSREDADQSSILVPPRMVSTGAPLRLRSTSSRRFRGTVEIPVDAHGRPDALGVRVIGIISELTKRDLQEWVAQTTFIPAKRDGVPVPGVFKMTIR